jgi:KDO2-lipid IV(A) lauroyltransferase
MPPSSVSRETLLLKLYKNLSKDLLLFFHGTHLKPLALSYKDRGKLQTFIKSGGILLTGHYHNWELLGAFLRKQGLPLVGAFTPFRSSLWSRQLLRLRERINLPAISHNIPRFSKSWIEKGNAFGILLDQHQDQGFPSSLFGNSVLCSKLPSFLLKSNKKPFYALFLQGNQRVRIIELWKPDEKKTKALIPTKLYRRYHKVLEILTKQEPHLWYGLTHKRFKNTHLYS